MDYYTEKIAQKINDLVAEYSKKPKKEYFDILRRIQNRIESDSVHVLGVKNYCFLVNLASKAFYDMCAHTWQNNTILP